MIPPIADKEPPRQQHAAVFMEVMIKLHNNDKLSYQIIKEHFTKKHIPVDKIHDAFLIAEVFFGAELSDMSVGKKGVSRVAIANFRDGSSCYVGDNPTAGTTVVWPMSKTLH